MPQDISRKVGDRISFHHQGGVITGTIKKIRQISGTLYYKVMRQRTGWGTSGHHEIEVSEENIKQDEGS